MPVNSEMLRLMNCLTLEDRTDRLPETSVNIYQSTLRNIPEELRPQVYTFFLDSCIYFLYAFIYIIMKHIPQK
jgi:hypothetical protein